MILTLLLLLLVVVVSLTRGGRDPIRGGNGIVTRNI